MVPSASTVASPVLLMVKLTGHVTVVDHVDELLLVSGSVYPGRLTSATVAVLLTAAPQVLVSASLVAFHTRVPLGGSGADVGGVSVAPGSFTSIEANGMVPEPAFVTVMS